MKLCLKCMQLREKTCPFKPEERQKIINCTGYKRRFPLPEVTAAGESGNKMSRTKSKYRRMTEINAEKQPPLTFNIDFTDYMLEKMGANSPKK